MAKFVSISDAESVVMQVLWKTSPLATEDVIKALPKGTDWQESTVKTLLARLLKKGAIKARKVSRRFLYSPVLAQADWMTGESAGLLDRVFGGRVAPFVAHFSQHRPLSRKDLAELKKLLKELDHGD